MLQALKLKHRRISRVTENVLRDRKGNGETDLRQQILCDSVELRNNVVAVPFGIDRKDSGVSGCVVDEDISSVNLIKEEIPTNEPRKEEGSIENKKQTVARRRRRQTLKYDETVDVDLNEKQQTEASHEMDGGHVTKTVDSTKEVS